MSRVTKTITFSLSPEMMGMAERIRRKENRTMSELLREALRRYIEEREWQEILRYGRMKAVEKGITEDMVEDIVDAYRE